MSIFKYSFFRAKPRLLFIQMLIDWMWWFVFQPQEQWTIIVFIAFLPGIDLVSAIGSFWNYLKDHQLQTK
ncbi:hypothetical protein ESZ50_07155 [Weissella muntiaci]|uniref:Uncharacterized protein n=1 Tax=Weissella muntiaci TaxID=2508881 RepID=A0A6C2C5A5_9LACO|nr:hypothetical protein [Weissella muntiaci]TYC49017.1 hypothetical protein ESZ50_07155 [Weissella muntiaci]